MKIKRFENGGLVTYTFNTLQDLKDKIDQWKSVFREKHKTDQIIKMFGRDKSYERFCEELDNLIEQHAEG